MALTHYNLDSKIPLDNSIDTEAIETNSAKVGITPEQATAITTNAEEVENITNALALIDTEAIETNTAKIGMTPEIQQQIDNNTDKANKSLKVLKLDFDYKQATINAVKGDFTSQAGDTWTRSYDTVDTVMYKGESAFEFQGIDRNDSLTRYTSLEDLQNLHTNGGMYISRMAIAEGDRGINGCFETLGAEHFLNIRNADGTIIKTLDADGNPTLSNKFTTSWYRFDLYINSNGTHVKIDTQGIFDGVSTQSVTDPEGNIVENTMPLIFPGEYFTIKIIFKGGLNKPLYLYVNDILVGNPGWVKTTGNFISLVHQTGTSAPISKRQTYLNNFGLIINTASNNLAIIKEQVEAHDSIEILIQAGNRDYILELDRDLELPTGYLFYIFSETSGKIQYVAKEGTGLKTLLNGNSEGEFNVEGLYEIQMVNVVGNSAQFLQKTDISAYRKIVNSNTEGIEDITNALALIDTEAIETNSAKVGITPEQATAITTNAEDILANASIDIYKADKVYIQNDVILYLENNNIYKKNAVVDEEAPYPVDSEISGSEFWIQYDGYIVPQNDNANYPEGTEVVIQGTMGSGSEIYFVPHSEFEGMWTVLLNFSIGTDYAVGAFTVNVVDGLKFVMQRQEIRYQYEAGNDPVSNPEFWLTLYDSIAVATNSAKVGITPEQVEAIENIGGYSSTLLFNSPTSQATGTITMNNPDNYDMYEFYSSYNTNYAHSLIFSRESLILSRGKFVMLGWYYNNYTSLNDMTFDDTDRLISLAPRSVGLMMIRGIKY